MRKDAFGLLWDEPKRPRIEVVREMPPIVGDWRPPKTFPNLSAAKTISIDTETFDPELVEFKDDYNETVPAKGPGWARGKGHLCGVSVGTEDGHSWYYPMRHEVQPEHNVDPTAVLSWLNETLNNPHQPKIGANLMYDYGWLLHEGVTMQGELVDVQIAEALLEEEANVSLETLAVKYLNKHKVTESAEPWALAYYGGPPTKWRKNIYRCPPCLIGPYAEADAELPTQIARAQYKELVSQGLLDVFRLENRLLPLLVSMRFAGVQVDLNKAEELRSRLITREAELQQALDQIAGYNVNVNAPASIAPAFDKLRIPYPRTAKTKAPSITKGYLENMKGVPIADLIVELRGAKKLRGTFVESYIMGSNVDGKIYCQFKSMRGDDGGTRSGRFSSATPNLQNIPSRNKVLAPLMRGLFIPDRGHLQWRKFDYSQIEYRCLAHYARGPGADALRAEYVANPKTDYHDRTHAMLQRILGIELDRSPTKSINFGLIYGMGTNKLMASLGLEEELALRFIDAYDDAAPYAKATMQYYNDYASINGYVTTVLGRRSRFDWWEEDVYAEEKPRYTYAEASDLFGMNIVRCGLHKALNRVLQGSAADMLKVAMVKCWDDGIFHATGVPRLTVHDELDFSDPGGCDAAFEEMKHVMETALPLSVPIVCDEERGPDWGHVKEV